LTLILKITKKIFSLFNLFLFIGSFCFTSLNGYASLQTIQDPGHAQKQFVSKHDVENNNYSQLLFEKNENENENESETDLQLQVLLLPFLISYFQFEIQSLSFITVPAPEVKYTNPIYLSVCNFRV